jgi:putative membrane-bound dehydrogenase-like protein
LLLLPTIAVGQTPKAGVLPVGADGKTLNLDFETGTLQHWKAEGEAFAGQPIKGDTVHPRRPDSYSRHQGHYWIGGYERLGDKATGTLTSVPFKVTHPWATFLVGGGPHANTCVELCRQDTGKVFFTASGLEQEDLRPVVVDLKGMQGKEIFIRLVDRHTGHWGHVNFDDFRFHTEQPKVAPRPGAASDALKFAGLPPVKAAQAMTVPEGFDVKLFAGEPDIVQPIAMCLDDRGRVWVAEAYSYPIRRPDREAKDRILIFEDVDGDGKFDKRTVFMEGLNLVSGLEVGFGGVWIGAAPYLMFVPMKDDRPAGEPQILLDGWALQDTHETLNSFIWGPDGWLYGCHGVFTHSKVGKPGTPDDLRVSLNAAVWRYHPTRHVFEIFAHGTSNPWGLDFDDRGQAFVEACVIPHCFHIIQGGRYQRQAGAHFNPYTYDDIKTIADHFHYLGATPHGGNNRSDSAGGGHAHCGLMCYLGGAWPAHYRGQLFMGNIHGRRINMDVLKPKGSGHVAGHGADFLFANDAWARFINLRYGPDGNVYLIDWYDKQACHHRDPNIWDRGNGRIYKICYRDTKPVHVDLSTKSSQELAELQLHENDWYVRHARRLLQERAREPAAPARASEELSRIAFEHKDPTRRLRALSALHVSGGLGFEQVEKALKDSDPHVRGWTIQLAMESPSANLLTMDKLVDLAANDPSPVVRRYLASALQRSTYDVREAVLEQLLGWDEDATDPNLPLLCWYALEPLAGNPSHRDKALEMARQSKLPNLFAFTLRRIADQRHRFARSAFRPDDNETITLIALRELHAAVKRVRHFVPPEDWAETSARLLKSKNPEVRRLILSVSAHFGDRTSMAGLREALFKGDLATREQVLTTLVTARDKDLPPLLNRLVIADAEMRGPALRALASYDSAQTPGVILDHYARFTAEQKRDALTTLAARPSYARALLDGVAAKRIAAADVSAELVRQLRNLRDKDLERRIVEVWGQVNDTPAERAKLIADYRKMLVLPAPADLALGRAIFAKTCQRCHTLFGEGGKVGPDITGANRGDLKYLLDNILDPSAFIPKEYAATVLELKSGRVVTGIVKEETPAALTVVTANETLTLPRADIESQKLLPTSMMPDDLVKNLSERELRALIAYLQSANQVPLADGPTPAKRAPE